MNATVRKPWAYMDCTIHPESGDVRYFGSTAGEYLTHYWRIDFPDGSWVYSATKQDACEYIRECKAHKPWRFQSDTATPPLVA